MHNPKYSYTKRHFAQHLMWKYSWQNNGPCNLRHLVCVYSRVHISQSTMECLHGEFDVEPGNGGDRCDYLRERGIDTYLVVVPKAPVGKNGINSVVSKTLHTALQVFLQSAFTCCECVAVCRTSTMHDTNKSPSVLHNKLSTCCLLVSHQKLSVTSSNGNSPLLINTTDCNGSVHTACTTPEEPEELDTRVTKEMVFSLGLGFDYRFID